MQTIYSVLTKYLDVYHISKYRQHLKKLTTIVHIQKKMFTSIHVHQFSFTFIHFHQFPSTFIHFHPLSTIFIQFHPCSSKYNHFQPCLTIFIHFIHFHWHLSTFIHFHPLSPTFIHSSTIGHLDGIIQGCQIWCFELSRNKIQTHKCSSFQSTRKDFYFWKTVGPRTSRMILQCKICYMCILCMCIVCRICKI